jgi:hypothetical protein
MVEPPGQHQLLEEWLSSIYENVGLEASGAVWTVCML